MIDWIATNSGIIGLIFFLVFFVLTALWVYRPGSKQSYQLKALIPLNENNHD